MPLTWNIREVDNHEELMEGDWEPVVTEALVWLSMSLKYGRITEQNAPVIYGGVTILEAIHGPFLHRDGKPYSITMEDVRRRIGMQTNAGSASVTEIKREVVRIVKDHLADLERAEARRKERVS